MGKRDISVNSRADGKGVLVTIGAECIVVKRKEVERLFDALYLFLAQTEVYAKKNQHTGKRVRS
jgi:hypothetical protein